MRSRLLTVVLLLIIIQSIECFKKLFIPSPADQVLVSDITHAVLMNKASMALNSPYLEVFDGQIATTYKGKIYGWARRALVSMPVRLSHKSCPTMINIIFKVDTGAPFSYLTSEALSVLYGKCPRVEETLLDVYNVTIAGHPFDVQESQAHLHTLNIIGSDFLGQLNCHLQFEYLNNAQNRGQFKLVIHGSQLLNKNDEQ